MKLSKKLFSLLMAFAMMVNMFSSVVPVLAEETNVLSSKTYTTYNGANASSAVDGNPSSFWDAGSYSSSPWIEFNLGGMHLIDAVNVTNYHGDARYYHYDVYVTADGTNYLKVAEKRNSNNATSSGDRYDFDAVYATHIKFVGVYHSKNSGFHFNELAAFGDAVEESAIDAVGLAKQSLKIVMGASYTKEDYSKDSWNAYETALNNAKNVVANAEATAQDVENAKTALEGAISALTAYVETRNNLALGKDVYVKDIEGGYKADGELTYSFFDPAVVTDGTVDKTTKNGNRTSLDSKEGNYLQIDLGSVYDFDRLEISAWPAGKQLNIEVSEDGTTWKSVKELVLETVDIEAFTETTVVLDNTVTGRYVKFNQPVIQIPGMSYSYKWGVAEIEIYGDVADLSALTALLNQANAYDAEDYTESSYATLQTQIDKAEAVVANSLSVSQVAAAEAALNAAIEGLVEVAEPTPTPTPTPDAGDEAELVNVALQKNGGVADADNVTVTGGDKAFLNNGNLKDAWIAASAATPVGVKVDFDGKYEVETVRIIFRERQNTNETLSFTVYYVDGNGNAVELYKGTSYNESNSTDTVGHKYYSELTLDSAVVMKGLRVTVTANATGEAVAIAEIQAWGKESDSLEGEKNLALGAAVTATQSYSAGYGPTVAVDGVSTSSNAYWHSGTKGLPQSMTIDLGESCTITRMVAYTYTDNSRYYLYDIEVSDDGSAWTKVASREETYGTIPSFAGEEYAFSPYLTGRYVRVNALYNSNGSGEFHMREFEVYGISNAVNVALDKPVSSSNSDNGSDAGCITDGDLGGFWDGGVASETSPQSFTIDLGSAYYIDSMKAYPYTDGSRRYDYQIEVSLDGSNWTEVADRSDVHGTVAAFAGEKFAFDTPVYGRFVRVNMTYNSANPSVHMREFEVFGTIDPNYVAPDNDPLDNKNLAYGKKVNSHLNTNALQAIVDGFNDTSCSGAFAPAYFDIDLEENVELSDIEIKFPVKSGRYYYFTVYGSVDGSNYDRLYQERSQTVPENALYKIELDGTYRIVRVFVEYVSDSTSSVLSEVRIHGNALGTNTAKLKNDYTLQDDAKAIETVLDMKSWEEWSNETYGSTVITEAEVIENVYGIIDRIIGSQYRSWFSFDIVEDFSRTKDWYSVGYDSISNKIMIKGNEGLSLSSGLNYYLKNYCNVGVSEQTVNGKMPSAIVPMDTTVIKENQVDVRYAFNYCTLNYTFSYADAEEFQREYDWMALNGVNCVLDLAGQEAVWIMFLMNFGYTYDEAKDWIAGGTYYAWQFMDNMEVIGGPVSDEWVAGRLQMARENQRWKTSLGMETVLQGYAGMIPNNFGEYQDVEILEQGTWCNLPRPDMIRTDGALYDAYAELFYEAQDWAFGNTSNYYAVDPFHEGGIRPDDLTDDVIAANVLDSLLDYDSDAVWMVQAWWANPTNELLNGMGTYREDHVLILDLMGLNSVYNTPYWQQTSYYNGATVLDEDEFNSTSWVWCMLDNYGGNPGMDGRPEETVKRIQYAYNNAEHMKGLGFISEATYDNPLIYDLVFDLAWVTKEELNATTPAEFLSDWLDTWMTSRYGAYSESAREAWDILLETVYKSSGNPTQVILSTNPSLDSYGTSYSFDRLEKALELLYEDYDLLSQSECYRYDLTEVMRQIVSNYAAEVRKDLSIAYNANDAAAFAEKKAEFLNAFDLLDAVTATQQDLLIGEWVGSAADWATDTGADDFAYDAMTINAKTLITVWAPTTYLGTYAYRHYNGVITDIYKPIWEAYLKRCEETLATGTATTPSINYTKHCMEWIYTDWADQVKSSANPDGYIRYADNSVENMKNVVEEVLDTVIYVDPINVGNIAMEKPVETNAERPDSPGAPGGGYATNVNDGLSDSYWDGITWEVAAGSEPYVIIDLEDEYVIDKINVLNYVAGNRYYWYDVYVSTDKTDWTQVADREETYGTTPSPDAGDDYLFTEDQPVARYVKLVGLRNSSNEGFHVKEIRVYGEKLADYTAVEEAIAAAEALNKDEYVDFSAVEAAIEAVVSGKKESDQDVVDGYAEAINQAIAALEKKSIEDEGVESKIELSDDLNEIAEALGFESVEELEEAMLLVLVAECEVEFADDTMVILDAILKVSFDGGLTWVDADEEHWPEDGKLLVTLSYEALSGFAGIELDSEFNYYVAHMFTSAAFGKTPGDVEIPEVRKTATGIQFYVTGFSPIMIAWEKITGEPGQVIQPVQPPISTSPSTSDSSNLMLWAALALISMMGLVVFRRKRITK